MQRKRGSTIVELGPTLFIVFIVFVFPMLAFGAIGMRYIFFASAARTAALGAAKCKSFLANPLGDVSAVNLARTIAYRDATAFSGITLAAFPSAVKTYVKVCPLGGGVVSGPAADTPLATPADTSTNVYNCEVVLTGQLEPFVKNPSSFLGSVPGLSAPIQTTARFDAMFENTQGLNQ